MDHRAGNKEAPHTRIVRYTDALTGSLCSALQPVPLALTLSRPALWGLSELLVRDREGQTSITVKALGKYFLGLNGCS